MKTALAIALVALFLAVVEVKGQQEKVVEVEEEEKGGKISQHDWDYYGEEVASDKKRKRRQTFEEKRELDHQSKSPGDAEEGSRLKRNPKKSAIRINQEMAELNTKNNTEPLLAKANGTITLYYCSSAKRCRYFPTCRNHCNQGMNLEAFDWALTKH